MKYSECRSLLMSEFDISKSRANEVLSYLDKQTTDLKTNAEIKNVESALFAAGKKRASVKRLDALYNKKKMLLTQQKFATTWQRVDKFLTDNPKASATNALKAEIFGLPGLKSGENSLDLHLKVAKKIHLNNIFKSFKDSGLSVKILNDPTVSRNTTKILLGELIDDKASTTAASILKRELKALHEEQLKVGLNVGYIENYIPQKWLPERMARHTSKEFIRDVMEVSTFNFEGNPDIPKILQKMYNDIIRGYSLDDIDPSKGFGKANKAGSSYEFNRKIHIDNPDDWIAIAEKYGDPNPIKSIFNYIHNRSRMVALVDRLGFTPEETLAKVVKSIAITHPKRKKVSELVNSLDGSGRSFDRKSYGWDQVGSWYDSATNALHIPQNPGSFIYKLYRTTKMIQNLSKLGSATVASLNDIFIGAQQSIYRGTPLITAWGESIHKTLMPKGVDVATNRKVAEYVGIYGDSMSADIVNRWDPIDSGSMSGIDFNSIESTFFKMTGLTWWTDHMRSNFATILSHDVAEMVTGGGFANVRPEFVRTLSNYDISGREFDLLNHCLRTDTKGRNFIDLEGLNNPEIKTKFYKFFINETENGILAPQAAEMYYTSMGFQAGSAWGMISRLVMQFKTYPISYHRRMIMPAVRQIQEGNIYGGVTSISSLLMATLAGGALSSWAWDVVNNRTPRAITPTTVGQFFIKGGGGGLLVDFLAQDYSRPWKNPWSTLLGPTVSDSVGFIEGVSGAVRGDPPGGRKMLRAAKGLVPGNNIWYLRGALEYLLMVDMYEALEPGYMRKMKKSMDKRGQELLFID